MCVFVPEMLSVPAGKPRGELEGSPQENQASPAVSKHKVRGQKRTEYQHVLIFNPTVSVI